MFFDLQGLPIHELLSFLVCTMCIDTNTSWIPEFELVYIWPTPQKENTMVSRQFPCTLPETNSLHLKMDGWKMSFHLERPTFRAMLVVGRVRRSRLRLECDLDLWIRLGMDLLLGLGRTAWKVGVSFAPKNYISQFGRGSHNPVLRGQQLAIWFLTTC